MKKGTKVNEKKEDDIKSLPEMLSKGMKENEIEGSDYIEVKGDFVPKGMHIYSFNVKKSEFELESYSKPTEVTQYATKESLIRHPEDRYLLSRLAMLEPNHGAAINIKAMTVANAKWKLKKDKNGVIKEFLKCPNNNVFDRISNILFKLQYDYEIYNNAYLEVISLGKKAKENSIYHVNGRDVIVQAKRRSDGSFIPGRVEKYHQVLSINNTLSSAEFFPIERNEDLAVGRHYLADLEGYTTENAYYGLPSYISSVGSILENMVIKRYIYSFFENNASPNVAILITGAELSPANKKSIMDHIDKMKGVEGAHSILLLSIPEADAKIDIKEIQKSVDAHFIQERDVNRTEILQTHLVPPKLLGISSPGSLGSGSEMIGAMKEFLEMIVEPKQRKLAEFMNTIFEYMFGFDPGFVFVPYNLSTEKDIAIIYNLLSKIKDVEGNPVITVQEIRENYNLPAKIKGKKMAVNDGDSDNKGTGEDGSVNSDDNADLSGSKFNDLKDNNKK